MTTVLHPPGAASGVGAAPSARAAEAPSLTELIDGVAGILPPVRKLGEFVGLNPMAGLEHLPFDAATLRSMAVLGGRRTPAEEVMRAALASGRITEEHLTAALLDAAPWIAEGSLTLGGQSHTLLSLVKADLTAGPIDGTPSRARRTLSEALAAPIAAQIDRRTSRWCAAFYDAGEAGWPMPHREQGLYGAWRALAPHEPGMPRRLRRALRSIPADALTAIAESLATLGVPDGEHGPYLEAHLGAMPGWSAYAHHVGTDGQPELADLLAIRLVQEAALLAPQAWRPSLSASAPLSTQVPSEERATALLHRLGVGTAVSRELAELTALLGSVPRRDLIWLAAYEATYRDSLIGTLAQPASTAQQSLDAQLVCCIDARSEGLRRALDGLQRYETHGFAGFFGLPMQLQLEDGSTVAQCPVPIAPSVTVAEDRAPGEGSATAALRDAADAAIHAAHRPGAGAFIYAEAAGAFAAPRAALRTSAPALSAARPADASAPIRALGLSTEALVDHAAGILSSLGLSTPWPRSWCSAATRAPPPTTPTQRPCSAAPAGALGRVQRPRRRDTPERPRGARRPGRAWPGHSEQHLGARRRARHHHGWRATPGHRAGAAGVPRRHRATGGRSTHGHCAAAAGALHRTPRHAPRRTDRPQRRLGAAVPGVGARR